MTETTNRTPAGVPTGGQFAASVKTESGISLASATDISTPIGRALLAADRIAAYAAKFQDTLTCAAEAADIRAKHPTARYAVLVTEEDARLGAHAERLTRVTVLDHDFEPIDEYITNHGPLHYGVPDAVRDEAWTDAFDEGDEQARFLDVSKAAVLDIDAEESAFRARVAHSAVQGSRIEAFIVDADVVRDQILVEIDAGQIEDRDPGTALSDAQEAEVVERVMADRRLESGFYPAYDNFHALVREHTGDVAREESE